MLLNFFPNHFSDFVKSLNLFATHTILVYELWYWIDNVVINRNAVCANLFVLPKTFDTAAP